MSTNNHNDPLDLDLSESLQKVAQNLEWARPEVVEFTIDTIRDISNDLMWEAIAGFESDQAKRIAQHKSKWEGIIAEIRSRKE